MSQKRNAEGGCKITDFKEEAFVLGNVVKVHAGKDELWTAVLVAEGLDRKSHGVTLATLLVGLLPSLLWMQTRANASNN